MNSYDAVPHMMLQNVKKIKGAADKNGLKNITCKQDVNVYTEQRQRSKEKFTFALIGINS